MPYLETSEQNDTVVYCQDGKYRWIYEQPMMKSLFLLMEVWRVLLIAALIPFVILLIVSKEPFGERLLNALLTLAIPLGILLVLSLPAYLIVTRANNGKYTVLFEMDEQWISHTQIKTEKARALEVLTMFAGAAAHSPTTAGIGMLNASGGSLTCRLEKVRSIKGTRRKNLIRVNTLLKRNQVYVTDSDFDFVFGYLKDHCPNAKTVLK